VTDLRGLTVRWSLVDAPAGVEEELAAYVADTSYDRFSALPELAFKTWRMVPGEWFEGCYVFADEASRAEFQATFTAGAVEAPGSVFIGRPPELIEACAVVAIAEGGAGFHPARRA
jgi:hypothetical protein